MSNPCGVAQQGTIMGTKGKPPKVSPVSLQIVRGRYIPNLPRVTQIGVANCGKAARLTDWGVRLSRLVILRFES